MDFSLATYGLGLLAGVVSTLSPCVLPLLPILVVSALSEHRLGSVALGAGLALSYSLVGLWLATLGAALGLNGDTLRTPAAILMILAGLMLLVPALEAGFARGAGRLASFGQGRLERVGGQGLLGQFAVGALLGLVWSPCVGPTLGAAVTLAAQGRDLTQIGLLMACFGVGAALPLVVLGMLSQATLKQARSGLGRLGHYGKRILGALFVVLGTLLASGISRVLEGWLLDQTPAWLTAFTTRF